MSALKWTVRLYMKALYPGDWDRQEPTDFELTVIEEHYTTREEARAAAIKWSTMRGTKVVEVICDERKLHYFYDRVSNYFRPVSPIAKAENEREIKELIAAMKTEQGRQRAKFHGWAR